ncbi:uncharacterized protein EI97DRAFT_87976 [Westerdykella ornata]|uniref:Uncharacterized protein n=1 Tax=Westerdykella ornata TaxID=318751 RepID=A0A6A6JFP8_WESOR|nr:uncharacterized protein EI97DRAFT_87976 [Westerdykella ornata]KAF2275095.1 hypothetical protein EI97DRAFT_87976 [Westerdykella ornata]
MSCRLSCRAVGVWKSGSSVSSTKERAFAPTSPEVLCAVAASNAYMSQCDQGFPSVGIAAMSDRPWSCERELYAWCLRSTPAPARRRGSDQLSRRLEERGNERQRKGSLRGSCPISGILLAAESTARGAERGGDNERRARCLGGCSVWSMIGEETHTALGPRRGRGRRDQRGSGHRKSY